MNVPPPTNREYQYPRDFESLFHNVEELAKRLTTLGKRSTAKHLTTQDGVARGAFEHSRYDMS